MNNMKRLMIVGPPGSGKGTQAEKISQELKICHISTGDTLRESINKKTEFGIEAKSYMDKGELVPDNVVIRIVEEKLKTTECSNGFLLDGFPRTSAQAEALDEILQKLNNNLDHVIVLNVKEEELFKRLVNRRTCKTCGKIYHLIYEPPSRQGICGQCGGELYQRDDDKEETVKNRLKIYNRATEPLIEFYKKKGLLLMVDGNKNIKEVFEDILSKLSAHA